MAEDDPERCACEPVDEGLDLLIHAHFKVAQNAAAARLGPHSEAIGFKAVSSSVEFNTDGDRWLKFLATDGCTWYMGWAGDWAEAISSAESFAQTMVDSII